jgi:hypothetical protein
MGVGFVAVLCAFGTLAAPALAKKVHTKPPRVLGKFVANFPSGKAINESSPVTDKGIGSVERIELAEGAITIGDERCKKIKSSGSVNWERSDTIIQVIKFQGCKGTTDVGTSKNVKEQLKLPNFKIAFEFHSNGFAESGEGETSSVNIQKTSVFVKASKGSPCTIEIPAQTIPVKATKKPENEFEAASYETEEIPAKIKKFPKGFQEKLDIEMEFKKVIANVLPSALCSVGPGFKNNKGIINAELEEITIKNGNLGFRDKEEVEAEEGA